MARAKDGRLDLDRARVRAIVLALGDGPVELILRRPRAPKSRSQNRLWRAIVDVVAESTGEDHDRTHYAMLGRCFGYEWFRITGEGGPAIALLPRVGHSAPLTKRQMSEAIDWAFRWVPDPHHGLGITIPTSPFAFDDGVDNAE